MSKKEKPYSIKHPKLDSLQEAPPLALIPMARLGIQFKDFLYALNSGPFNLKEWAGLLHLSERTIQRYEVANKAFEPLQSERIMELQILNKKGVQLFGSAASFRAWLDGPSIAFGGLAPISYLDSHWGISMVLDEIGRLEHGVYA